MRFIIRVCLISLMLSVPQSVYAYPGYAFFSYECIDQGIRILPYGLPPLEIYFSEMTTPLETAAALHENQIITSTGEIELWALQSDELQVHFNSDIEGTKLVLAANVCGTVEESGYLSAARLWTYIQSDLGAALADASLSDEGLLTGHAEVNGIGYAAAFAAAFPWGQIMAYAQADGGFAEALAQVLPSGQVNLATQANGRAAAGALVWTQTGGDTHTVAAGENLYRISLRYNTTVELLTLLNGLDDPQLIHPGQVLRLP